MLKTQLNSRLINVKEDLFSCINKVISNPRKIGSTLIIVPNLCNNVGIFAGRFANSINKNYPIVEQNYSVLGKNYLQKNFGNTQFVKVSTQDRSASLVFANMIAQDGLPQKNKKRIINYFSLVKCMHQISQYIEKEKNNSEDTHVQIHTIKIGVGACGGNWTVISELMSDIWAKYDCYIHNHN